MAERKKPTKSQPDNPLNDLQESVKSQPQPETVEQARARAGECARKVQEVLVEFQCRIEPTLFQEPIGGSEPVSKILVTSSYVVVPHPKS